MRGARCKQLRKLFKKEFGRPVRKTQFVSDTRYLPSEWRRLKKAYLRGAA